MRPTLRKLEVKDINDLERLVAENVEGIETGLKVIDSRLLLGQAAMDLVGLDAREALALIALGFTADESLLLRVMDAYSWCLEYPDTIRRLYPTARVSAEDPPRILFIVERLTDAFLRRLKQLSVPEIDCFEFRHLEVNGTSALYFDLVQSLRKPAPAAALSAQPAVAREPAVAASSPITAAPAASIPSIPVPSAPAPVAAPVPVAAPAPAPPPVEVPAPVVAVPPPAPVAPEPPLATLAVVEVQTAPEPVNGAMSLQQHLAELVAAAAAAAPPAEPAVGPEAMPRDGLETAPAQGMPDPGWQELLGSLGAVETPTPEASPVGAASTAALVEEPEPVAPAQAAPAPVVEAHPTPPAWARRVEKAPAAPGAARTYFFAQAAKTGGPVEPVPRVEAASAPAEPAPPAPEAAPAERPAEPRPELDALNFPKDGLSRQWLEFLNQLGAAK